MAEKSTLAAPARSRKGKPSSQYTRPESQTNCGVAQRIPVTPRAVDEDDVPGVGHATHSDSAASSRATYASISPTADSAACTLIATVSPMPCTPWTKPIIGDSAG